MNLPVIGGRNGKAESFSGKGRKKRGSSQKQLTRSPATQKEKRNQLMPLCGGRTGLPFLRFCAEHLSKLGLVAEGKEFAKKQDAPPRDNGNESPKSFIRGRSPQAQILDPPSPDARQVRT